MLSTEEIKLGVITALLGAPFFGFGAGSVSRGRPCCDLKMLRFNEAIEVVSDLSLTVESGQIHSLLGPNARANHRYCRPQSLYPTAAGLRATSRLAT